MAAENTARRAWICLTDPGGKTPTDFKKEDYVYLRFPAFLFIFISKRIDFFLSLVSGL